jgi:hypothetical protein
MRSAPLAAQRVFRITWSWRVFLFLVFFFADVLKIGLDWLLRLDTGSYQQFLDDVIRNSAFVLVFAVLYYLLIRNIRLVLSPQGITYYGAGFRLYTPWHNIIGTESFPLYYGLRKVRGLKLYQRAVLNMSLEDGMRYGVAVMEISWWRSNQLAALAGMVPIQIEIAGRHWEEHELGAYIRQYAPRAFENTAMQ